MAAQQKGASRWGWMQQAVASVESRLDTILGEEDEPQRKTSPAPPASRPTQDAPVKRDSMEVTRSGAGTPTNDRLQARLAQAMVKKNASRPETPVPASDPDSQLETPAVIPAPESDARVGDQETVRATSTAASPAQADVVVTKPIDGEGADTLAIPPEPSSNEPAPTIFLAARPSAEDISTRASAEGSPVNQSLSERPSNGSVAADAQSIVAQLETDKTHQEAAAEINGYIERIDALQAKLKYLSNEASESAKNAAAAAQNGTAEKKLLEKDAQIASLMQEGQKLSKTEMTQMQTIKKIRQQHLANTKEHDATKARADKAERSLRMAEDRAKRAEAAARRSEQNLTASQTSTADHQTIKRERDALNATLIDIKAQLSKANARADAADTKAETEQLEKERKRNADLQDDLTSMKVERELAEEKLRRELKDVQSLLAREKEHTQAMENEMLNEQATLESKLESFRARAEEASSSNQGGVQAKLLRQIETLQNQYSTASQNWQGIEGSLLARITALEKDRDEIANKEADVRKKLREATLKAKKAEREADEAQSRLPELEKAQIEAEDESQRSLRKIKQLEADLVRSHRDFEEQKLASETDFIRRLEEEKTKWAASLNRLDSPGASLRKGSSIGHGLGFDLTSPLERPVSRRQSYLPHHDGFTPPRQQSIASLKGLSNGIIPETPSLVTSLEQDEYFANVPPTPASQSAASPRVNQSAMHDLMSTSTIGAGPSVQLVERMSANVRRLESEKAASKDEIARLAAQRDEGRKEVVNLMREIEEKRNVVERLKVLETQHEELRGRHQTTLELLGEKSEMVEELKADVSDVKAMYRELVDTMGKT